MADVKSYSELPPHTRRFIEELSEEDLISLREGIRLAQATKTMGKFWKWTFILIFTAFTGMMAIGQSVEWLTQKIRGG